MSGPTGVEAEVCRDIAARQQIGIAKYGRTLAESEDDMLVHAYEEALDLAAYLKAEIIKRRTPVKVTSGGAEIRYVARPLGYRGDFTEKEFSGNVFEGVLWGVFTTKGTLMMPGSLLRREAEEMADRMNRTVFTLTTK